MNTKVNLQTILIVFMVCVTVIFSTNTYAKAQGGGENNSLLENVPESEIMLDPVPGGPGFIMVSAFDFKLYDSTNFQAYVGTSLYNPSITNATYSVAGLTLPHGATITKLTLYYYDNVTINMSLSLYNAVEDGYNLLASVSSSGALGMHRAVSQTDIADPIVDNQNFSYWLYLTIPQSANTFLRLQNVRIDYEYTSNLPAVMKN